MPRRLGKWVADRPHRKPVTRLSWAARSANAPNQRAERRAPASCHLSLFTCHCAASGPEGSGSCGGAASGTGVRQTRKPTLS